MSLRQNAAPLALEALATADAAAIDATNALAHAAAAAGAPHRLWLSAERFFAAAGAARSGVGWLFDAAADETVATTIAHPQGWTVMQLDLWLRGIGPDAGNARMRVYYGSTPYADGAGVPTPVSPWGVGVTVASGGTGVVAVAQNVIGTITVSDFAPHELWVGRHATNALDTLSIDYALVGVMLRGAS